MEAAIYVLDLLATALVMYWAVTNAARPTGEPTTGLFRYVEVLNPKPSVDAPPPPRQRGPVRLQGKRRSPGR